MPYFKDKTGGIHFIESEAFANLLPDGAVEISDTDAIEIAHTKPEPTEEEEIVAAYESALDAMLDSVAQAYRYADRTRLALRAGYPNQHQALAASFGTWMDACNDLAKQCYIDVKAGVRSLPTLDEFMAMFPPFNG